MPRDDAAKLIAEHLHAIPGIDGKPIRLLQYSTAGKSPEQTASISQRGIAAGKSLVALLEADGFTITHRNDPQPDETDSGFPVAQAHCAHCGTSVLKLAGLKRDPAQPSLWKATLYRSALEAMGHPHECWK